MKARSLPSPILERSDVAPLGFRLRIIGIIVASLFLALFARLIYLQWLDSEEFVVAAQANQVRTVYDEAPRGRILDRNGEVLVGNREVDVITAERSVLSKNPEVLGQVAALAGVDVARLRAAFDDPKASPYRPVPILRGADKEVVATIRERSAELPGIAASTQVERWYPAADLAAHVLGYVGEINGAELAARKEEGYRLGDGIGKSGIEAAYESDLRGRPGFDKIEVDSSGRPVRVLEHIAPVPGSDVRLSLDKNVQSIAESALAQGLTAARANGSGLAAPAGAVVAQDPRNGEILALASYPAYSPADFNRGIRVDEYAALTNPSGPLPLTNRAISGQYAPGSTFKLVTSMAALKDGLIGSNFSLNDGGAFVLGGRRYTNAQGRAYGPVDIRRALTVSSDVFFYSLGARFWDERKDMHNPIQTVANDLGLGSKLGVPLAGESAGRIPTPEGRRELHKSRPDAYPEGNWYAGDNVNLAIGQGDTLLTPLQLTSLYGTFANGGDVRLPLLVTSVIDAEGRPAQRVYPQVIRHVDIPQNVRVPIERGLEDAVRQPYGTAHGAFSDFDQEGFPVAGKTGTAQVNEKADTAIFAAYGPVGDPRVSVGVVLEEAGFGGVAAAPVGRSVLAAVAGQPQPAAINLGTGVD